MSWTDSIAIDTIKQLKDDFKIEYAVETGTFRGINAELYSSIFKRVITIEVDKKYALQARYRVADKKNVVVLNCDSTVFLGWLHKQNSTVFFYLDAHFYDSKRVQRWVVVDELKALQGYTKCVVCIHDFDNGEFGHLIYGGEPLNFEVVEPYLKEINPNFHYYTNTECNIYNKFTVSGLPITVEEGVIDSLEYANSSDIKKNRGILYATPEVLDLEKYKLREVKGG